MIEKPYRLPFGVESEEEFAELWACQLGGGKDFQARILATLEGAAPEPLFDEDQDAPSDAASIHYWFLVNLQAVIEAGRDAEEPLCLPCLADISKNPIAFLASRGNPIAKIIYAHTPFEKEWPPLMQDLDITSEALAFVGAIFRRFNQFRAPFLAEALEELFNPFFHSQLSFCFNWEGFRRFWRRAHLLEGAPV